MGARLLTAVGERRGDMGIECPYRTSKDEGGKGEGRPKQCLRTGLESRAEPEKHSADIRDDDDAADI